MAWFAALEQAVVALSVEHAVFVESGFLETMIYVGGQNELVFVFQQVIEVLVHRFRSVHVAVYINVPTPVGPVFL